MTQAFVDHRAYVCVRTPEHPYSDIPATASTHTRTLTSTQEIAVIENIFKLRSAQPSRIVTEMRSSLIDAMQS